MNALQRKDNYSNNTACRVSCGKQVLIIIILIVIILILI